MRALRVVGISDDGGELSVVLEDSARQERFMVPADEQLRAAARGDLTRLGQISIELESQLRPREIQARIRAGASVDQVAAAAGVPPQKIERFAYPVLLERSRTAEVAQRAHPMRADGPDNRMLGDVVAHTFGLRGQEYHSAEWDSWKGDDGRWVVALSWRAGRSDNRALWAFLPGAHGGTVTALDEHAHDLVEGLPARPLRTVGPVIDISRQDEPEPAPVEGHELRAAASDTAARRDLSDWSRGAPEPRRPEPPRRSVPPARTEPAEATQRPTPDPHGYPQHGRADQPATEWPAPQRQPDDRGVRRGEPSRRVAAHSGDGAASASQAYAPGATDAGSPMVPTLDPASTPHATVDAAPPAPRVGEGALPPAPRAGAPAPRTDDVAPRVPRSGGGTAEVARASAQTNAAPTPSRDERSADQGTPRGGGIAGDAQTADRAGSGEPTHRPAAPATPSTIPGGPATSRNGDGGRHAAPAASPDDNGALPAGPSTGPSDSGAPSIGGEHRADPDTPTARPQPERTPPPTDPVAPRGGAERSSRHTTATSPSAAPPVDAAPSSGTPSSGTPSSGTPSSGTPSSGTPSPSASTSPNAGTSPNDGDALPAADAAPPAPRQADAEPAPPRQADPAPPQAAPKRTRKGKPVMPSWDEVLLGVRSQR